jgi:hypothetical protein
MPLPSVKIAVLLLNIKYYFSKLPFFFISIKTIQPLNSSKLDFSNCKKQFSLFKIVTDPSRPLFSTLPPFCANHKRE